VAERETNIWKEAIDHLLIINNIGTSDDCKTTKDVLNKLSLLIEFEIQIATDPEVNGGFKLTKI